MTTKAEVEERAMKLELTYNRKPLDIEIDLEQSFNDWFCRRGFNATSPTGHFLKMSHSPDPLGTARAKVARTAYEAGFEEGVKWALQIIAEQLPTMLKQVDVGIRHRRD